MPRAKVRPENRKRAVQACTHCRSSKKRCNGQHPCTNCVRKGIAGLCNFEEPASSISAESPRREHRRLSQHVADRTSVPADTSVISPSGILIPSPAVTNGTQISSPEAVHRTHPRLLENSRGEKVFIGRSASLSFLQYIRDTVSQSLARSDFSNHAEQDYMFEGAQVGALPVAEVPLSLDQENDFLDLFFMVTPGFFDVFTKNQVLSMLAQYRNNELTDPLKIAIVWSIIAIGAQCSVRDHSNITISLSYFAEAQKRGFEGMVEDPCLEMVELFLLMAFYMLGACHRNAGYMYIGIAARAAYALGLHYVYLDPKQSPEGESQNRIGAIWKSLVTLDTIVSSILGRPAATSSRPTKYQGRDASAPGPHLMVGTAMQANYEMACLLDQKVQKLYKSEKVTAEGALACLDELSAWSARLPPEVRLASDTPQSEKDQEQVIGGLHVSCFYYFAVMLVSRPFLVVHLTNRLAKSRFPSEAFNADHGDVDMEADVEEIADACRNAATYTIETCMETQSHGYLPDNMRILKAWIFGAGLVLGFDMFTSNQSSQEIEFAFANSCKLLKTLSNHSPLAAHYLNILNSLSDAISARRRQARQERRRSNRPIVEKIMAFKAPEAGSTTEKVSNTPYADATANDFSHNNGNGVETWGPSGGPDLDFDFQDMMNEPFLNWDTADFLIWDPFSNELPV